MTLKHALWMASLSVALVVGFTAGTTWADDAPAATAPATPVTPATQVAAPKELADTIQKAITLLEAGKNDEVIKLLMPPDELAKISLDKVVASFADKAQKLLAALKETPALKPTMKDENSAEYPATDDHPALRFSRIDGKWYLK